MSRSETIEQIGELIQTCDRLIKSGEIAKVVRLLQDVSITSVPRIHRQALAKICRRSGQIKRGLRLLYPLVRNEKAALDRATAGEICEYAVLLSRSGLTNEALALVREVHPSAAPEAKLYEAFCHISLWNYDEAATCLERYLAMDPDPYSRMIAHVNLGAAYLALAELDKAEEVLSSTIATARAAGATRLAGNCLEQRAHFHIQKADFTKARADLDTALGIFGTNDSYDGLLVAKWASIIDAVERGSIEPLVEFRARAVSMKHWESVREADLFACKVKFNQAKFDALVFGSPMPGYRAWAKRQVSHDPSPEFWLGDREARRRFDMTTGEWQGGAATGSETVKVHDLLRALTKDLYAPIKLGALFAELYPQDYFDIESSPLRIRQIIFRARRWLMGAKLPCSIEQIDGAYTFTIKGPFAIRLDLERDALITGAEAQWRTLLAKFPVGARFGAREACELLHLSRSSFLRLSRWAFEHECLEKSGSGSSTTYVVKRAA